MTTIATRKSRFSMQVMLVGGFSLISFFFIKLMGSAQADATTSWFIYYFSFIANFPHFLVSYQLLYWDFKDRSFSNYRYIVATIVSPGILAGLLIYGIATPDTKMLGHILNAMYFFVGWHYIKQTFGVISVSNVREKVFYNVEEKRALKGMLYGIWALSWVSLNISGAQYAMEGIPYTSYQLPPWCLQFCWAYLVTSALYCAWIGYKKYIREGVVISFPGLVSIIALLAWYLPVFYNPTYFLIVPLFHSLQYLYFVYLVKSNQAEKLSPVRKTPEQRQAYFKAFYGYLIWPFILGAIFMWFLPKWLDSTFPMTGFSGANPYMFAFTIFINIHHYFIDHAIWRHDNPTMKNYLFIPEEG
jgi:hypothetical protein